MTEENKQILVNRLKSLAWRGGLMALLAGINFLAENAGLIGFPTWSVVVISLIGSEITKLLNK